MTVDGRQRSSQALANAKRAVIISSHSADADHGRRGGQKLPIAMRATIGSNTLYYVRCSSDENFQPKSSCTVVAGWWTLDFAWLNIVASCGNSRRSLQALFQALTDLHEVIQQSVELGRLERKPYCPDPVVIPRLIAAKSCAQASAKSKRGLRIFQSPLFPARIPSFSEDVRLQSTPPRG